jgi:hypothetical protein
MTRLTKEALQFKFFAWLVCSAVLCSIPGCLAYQDWSRAHWLNTDGKHTTGTVIAFDRPILKYSFVVGTREYTGRLKVINDEPTEPGAKLDVFYSSTYPQISTILIHAKPPFQFRPGGYIGGCIFICVLVLVIGLIPEKKKTT